MVIRYFDANMPFVVENACPRGQDAERAPTWRVDVTKKKVCASAANGTDAPALDDIEYLFG